MDKNTTSRIHNIIKKIRLAVTIIFAFALVVVFIYKNDVKDVVKQKYNYNIAVPEDGAHTSDLTIELTESGDTLVQSFWCGEEGLSAVVYSIKVIKHAENASLLLEVSDADTDIIFGKKEISVADLPAEGDWKILLDKIYEKSAGKNIRISVKAINFTDTCVAFYSVAKNSTRTVFNNTKIGCSPILTVDFRNNDFLKQEYFIFSGLVFLFIVICYVFLYLKKISLEKFFVPLCIFLGCLYLLAIPMYSVPDEYTHMDTAYSLSNRMMGIKEPEGLTGYDYKRACDIETEEYLTYSSTVSDYRRLYTELFTKANAENLQLVTVQSALVNVSIVNYLPQAIGITIGRMIGVGGLPLYLLGRLMNLLAYTFLAYSAIKKSPGFKNIFFIIATLPIFLQQAASFSYDAVLNGIILVFIAYCLFYCDEKSDATIGDALIFVFCLSQLATIKGGVYLPLCLLGIIVPLERRWNIGKSIKAISAMAIFTITAFALKNIDRLVNNYFMPHVSRVNPFNGNEMYTVSYLKSNPIDLIKIMINTVYIHGSRLIYELFGGKMGSLTDLQLPWLYIIAFIFILSAVMKRDTIFQFNNRWSIRCIGLVSFLGTVLIVFSMLLADTAISQKYISGLQGRYFLAAFLLAVIVMCANKSGRENKEKLASTFLIYGCVHGLFLLNIVKIVMTKY